MTGMSRHRMGAERVDKSGERVRQMFGEIAPRYDLLNHLLSAGVDYYWRWYAVRTVAPHDDAPILDLCTGTGDLALAYWRKSGYRVQVIGADFTHSMLELARHKFRSIAGSIRRRAGNQSIENVHFIEADAQSLPFADNEFQIVSVAFGLRNVADTARGLQEMTRVCRPGGHVVVLEFALPANRLVRKVYEWYFRHILPRIGQLVAWNRQMAYHYLPQSVREFPQWEAMGALMEQCGLTRVHWRPLTFGIAALYCGVKSDCRTADVEQTPTIEEMGR